MDWSRFKNVPAPAIQIFLQANFTPRIGWPHHLKSR
jgi:hypothetical protein